MVNHCIDSIFGFQKFTLGLARGTLINGTFRHAYGLIGHTSKDTLRVRSPRVTAAQVAAISQTWDMRLVIIVWNRVTVVVHTSASLQVDATAIRTPKLRSVVANSEVYRFNFDTLQYKVSSVLDKLLSMVILAQYIRCLL